MPKNEWIFYSTSPKMKIGADQLQSEICYGNGNIKQASMAIDFDNHIHRTSKPRVAEYIKKTQSFINRQIREITEADVATIQGAKVSVVEQAQSAQNETEREIVS